MIALLQNPVDISAASAAEAALNTWFGGKDLQFWWGCRDSGRRWLFVIVSRTNPLKRRTGDTEVDVEERTCLATALGALATT